MSKIAISPGATGNAVFTIQAPSTETSRTLNLPDNSGTVLTTSSTFAGTGPAFSAWSNIPQSTTAGSITKIQLNVEVFDTNGNFDPTTNYRFTPTVAGYYQITGVVTYVTTTNNHGLGAVIYKNGSAYAWGTAVATTSLYPSANVASLIYLNGSTDYVELYVYNGTGATVSTGDVSTYTYMTGFLARAA
jgi:hypothetical protein